MLRRPKCENTYKKIYLNLSSFRLMYLEFAEYDEVARLTDIAVALMAPMSAIFVGDDELSKMYLTVLKV